MVIYEVNLEVDKAIEEEYATWLADHVREMLEMDGFESAEILRDEDVPPLTARWVVHYPTSSQWRHVLVPQNLGALKTIHFQHFTNMVCQPGGVFLLDGFIHLQIDFVDHHGENLPSVRNLRHLCQSAYSVMKQEENNP